LVLYGIYFFAQAIAIKKMSTHYYLLLLMFTALCTAVHYRIFFKGELLFTQIKGTFALELSSLIFLICFSFGPVYYIKNLFDKNHQNPK
jgi:hypothetical protein